MHCQQAKSQIVPSGINQDKATSSSLQQLLGECDILLTHLPEALNNGAADLLIENCLELANAICFAMMYSKLLSNQLGDDQQLQSNYLITEALSKAESVFHALSISLTSYSNAEESTYKDVTVLQHILLEISSLFEDVEFGKDADQSQMPLKEDLQTVVERAEQAELSAHKLREHLDNAQYTAFELGLSRYECHRDLMAINNLTEKSLASQWKSQAP